MKSAIIKTTYKLPNEFEKDINNGRVKQLFFEDNESNYFVDISKIPNGVKIFVKSTAGWTSIFSKIGDNVVEVK